MRHCFRLLIILVLLIPALASEAKSASFTYDDAGRLLTAEFDDGSSLEYAYDDAGNLRTILARSAEEDNDTDGVSDTIESQVPTPDGSADGDGNGDSFADASQAHVTSLPGYDVTDYITVVGTPISNSAYGENTAVTAVARDSAIPSPVTTPLGMVEGNYTVAVTGEELVFTVYVPRSLGINGLYAKRATDNAFVALDVTVTTSGSKTVLTANIVDGGLFDLDGAENGQLQIVAVPVITGVPYLPYMLLLYSDSSP